MAPWQDTSPLAAALGAATGYFQGKKEKSDEAYKRSEQAFQDRLQKEALDAQLKQYGGVDPGPMPMPGQTTTPGPSAAPAATTALPGPLAKVKPGTKTLGTVSVHATRTPPAAPENPYDARINWAIDAANKNASDGYSKRADYYMSLASQFQAMKAQADTNSKNFMDYVEKVRHDSAEEAHWSQQDKDFVQRTAAQQADAIARDQTTIEAAQISVGKAIDVANINARSRMDVAKYVQPQITGRTKYVQGATTGRANAAISAAAKNAGGANVSPSTGAVKVPGSKPAYDKNGKSVTQWSDGQWYYDDGTPYTP